MKKVTLWIFIIIVAAIVAYFFGNRFLFARSEGESETRSKVVVPQVENNESSDEKKKSGSEDENRASFIALATDETLIDSLTIDFTGDGHEDQISAVKTSFSPYIIINVAVFDSDSSSFVRKTVIPTKITQVRTFSMTTMDVIGTHKNSLVYQGFSESGNSILTILTAYFDKKRDLIVETTGDFESDGSIFIQQLERNESYELSRSKGKSYPVIVSSTVESEDSKEFDQLQTTFEYDENQKLYVETDQKRLSQSHLARQELQRIQDGTVETFTDFLNGLWYKTENAKSIRYIYFDYQNQEIVFLYEDSEEVYSWNNSTLRRNGIYLTTVNSSIENLQRRFDISLVSIDSIRLKLHDDVRMIIKESNVWDGTYKKMTTSKDVHEENNLKKYYTALAKGGEWKSGEGYSLNFSDGNYTAATATYFEKGNFTDLVISGTELLQFRSLERTSLDSGTGTTQTEVKKDFPSILKGVYHAEFKLVEPERPATRKTKARPAIYDFNTIILSPVTMSPTGYFRTDGMDITLKKTEE